MELFSSPERHLFQLMTGFFAAKLLSVAVELDLFTWFSQRPRRFEEVQARFGFATRPCQIFLDALASLGLIEQKDELYSNSVAADTLLVQGRPDFQGPHIQCLDHLYRACGDLKAALFEDRPVNHDYTYFFDPQGNAVTDYSQLMHATSLIPVLALSQCWDFSESKTVLDVGGGYGRLCVTLVSHYPGLRTILFDLPPVCQKARELLRQYPPEVTGRVHVHPGNFFHDPFPKEADTIVMMRVAHDWSRAKVELLFHKAYAALPCGGRLLVYETFKEQGPQPGDAALISLLLLLISPGGECRTFADMQKLLQGAGFSHIEFMPTVYFYGLAVAEKF